MVQSKLDKKQRYELIDAVFQSELQGKRITPGIYFINKKTASRFIMRWASISLVIALIIAFYFASLNNQYHLRSFHNDSRFLLTALILVFIIVLPFAGLMRWIMASKGLQDSTVLYVQAYRYLKRNLKYATNMKLVKIYDLSLYKKLFFAYFVGKNKECVALIKNNKNLEKLNRQRSLNLTADSKLMRHDKVLSKKMSRQFKLEFRKIESQVDTIIEPDCNKTYQHFVKSNETHKLPEDLWIDKPN